MAELGDLNKPEFSMLDVLMILTLVLGPYPRHFIGGMRASVVNAPLHVPRSKL